MKAPDEEEYGSYYASRGSGAPRYRYTREYSPSRGHHQQPSSSMGMSESFGLPPTRTYTRSSPYGGGGRNLVEYGPPPCCHQFYHAPSVPASHPSSSHFNTIPHPPLQYRDVPACATLSRSCYGKRGSPYATFTYEGESPYGDPRSDIYYTTTMSRHPRHNQPSSSRAFPQDVPDSVKIYESPSGASGFHPHGPSAGPSLNLRSYAPPPPLPQGSILRLDEPRIYSSSALQLGSNPTTIQRSSSPQQAFIDRSISLIRLDSSNSAGPLQPPPLSEASNPGSSNLMSSQPRIKFHPGPESSSQSQISVSSMGPALLKSTIELGSSSDPLSITPAKQKFKGGSAVKEPKEVVEMSDKAVMTSQHPEQWSLLSCGSERRISLGTISPQGNQSQAASTLAGGIPDLLPSCVVRSNDYSSNAWRSSAIPSPRRACAGLVPGTSAGTSTIHQGSSSTSRGGSKNNSRNSNDLSATRWSRIKSYIRRETRTFFGLKDSEELKEEWLSRRKRFASRRYSERNVDSMPPPSPYQPGGGNLGPHAQHPHEQVDGRIPTLDHRPITSASLRGRRTRKKDHVFVVYWNLIRWIFWALRFGRTGQRVAAGAGCGSDTNPGSGSTSPGRVPLDSQMSRDRTKSRSISPTTLAEIPPNVTISPQELFFDDYEDNHRNSLQHLQPPGRGLHWRIARQAGSNGGIPPSNRISSQFLNKVLDNSERQQFRQGLRQPTSTISKLALIDEYEDFRPYFTYWISTVQIIILLTSMITYGIAPVGLDLHRKSSLVLVTSLSLQQMEIIQPANFWIGPSAADLIHLGAKFAPCMRKDEQIYRRIVETRDRERQTACCIRNDNSGCVQSSRNECSIKGVSRSGLLSTWKKWTREEGPGGRISGSVCGLDPKFCEAPASIAPYEWPDDITKWPICRKTRGLSGMSTKDKTAEHMVCEVIGHPCCIGIHAKCLITTREYCRFVNGYFHEEASLCSQVSCLQDVCGMFPFLAYEQPDQFYRLFSSLFLHAGLGHIIITLGFHIFIMRDLEKLAGPLRIALIYIGAGIAGNLASVLLEPHRAEVGPGGGQYGLIACLLIELRHMWGMLRRPWMAAGKMVLVTGSLFLIGFLPWVDNFAHLSGFFVGILLSHALMPYIAFRKYSSYRKCLEVVICLCGYFAILLTLLVFFYTGFGDCEHCRLLNCLPLTQDFCAEQDIDFKPSGGGINLIT